MSKANRCIIRLIGAAISLYAAAWLVLSAGLPDRAQANAQSFSAPGMLPVAPEIGALAPPLEAVDLNNHAVSLAALRGHPVIVNFWATWCGPCVAETPLLQSTYGAHHKDGLYIIGVAAPEPLADLASWRTRFGVTYDLVTDSTGQINTLYRVRGLPSSVFITRDGTIQQIVYGPLTAEVIQTELTKMLQ